MKKIRFLHGTHSDFSRELDKRVKAYFRENNLSPYANTEMIFVSVLFTLLYLGAYALIISNRFSPGYMLLFTVVMGITSPSIFLNLAHTAGHKAFSRSKRINKLLLNSLELIGMNAYIFEYLHNRVHHSFTSIEGADVIVEELSLIRLSENQPYQKIHSRQVWYAPFLYMLFSIILVFSMDFQLFKRKRMGNIFPVNHPRKAYISLYIFKLFYVLYTLVIPMIVLSVAWWQVLLAFLMMHAISSFFFACVGVLNHQIDESLFPSFDEEGYIHDFQKNHELAVTIDFSPDSKLATYFFGGFNTHVAHHLFPEICHCHYPVVTRIIQQTAAEYGLSYKSFTLWGAIRSHMRYLKRLSVPPSVQTAH
ncbi:linoleoyl-CoA desaturase [Chitinophaga sp. CF118]|uniref:fatty acid desaturase family protein n=1 Tax=Chitinophaga sp. CF118 TaxID=1884367 RepID=UPI0008E50929|nr:fatty acid desaturase [Chitinophaga sp. CF118]SFD82713.1 linoleoyl-CoA desaturase [Chitinophaga sp. CF118]